MKMNNLIKQCLFLVCALYIGSANAVKNHGYTSASTKLQEKEAHSKQADKKLAEDVKETFVNEKLFGKDKFIDMGIRITAKKGGVTISGRVDEKENVEEAVNMAKSVEGVKSVYSKLVVKLIKQP